MNASYMGSATALPDTNLLTDTGKGISKTKAP